MLSLNHPRLSVRMSCRLRNSFKLIQQFFLLTHFVCETTDFIYSASFHSYVCAEASEYLFKRKTVMTITLSATVYTPPAIRNVCSCVHAHTVCVCARNICRFQRGNSFPKRVFYTALQSAPQISERSSIAVSHPL